MSDFPSSDSATNVPEYSVSEISAALKRTVEDAFGNVRVRGEISGYRGPHSSGHAYFSLKDDRARIEAVVWRSTLGRLRFRPEEGMEVIATGRLTTFPGKSTYQIVIDRLEPAGAGALMALLEERKRRLQAEGLFAAERKRKLPFMPRIIGVVTSPTGAVIRDIVHRIKDRFPLTVIVWPVRVQGETCGAEVAAAVNGFNALPADGPVPRPQVIIVARGGGSLEDLWGFNDEDLARAVAASTIPVISAVGHETDWTLVDYAADMRAPTPTGAAEMAVPVKADLEAMLAGLGARLARAVTRGLDRRREGVRACARALPSPDQLLALPRRRFDDVTSRLGRGLSVNTERKRARLSSARLAPAAIGRQIADYRRLVDRDLKRALAALSIRLGDRRGRFDRAGGRLSIDPLLRRQSVCKDAVRLAWRRARLSQVQRLESLRGRVRQADRLLSTLSHQSVLERGFALVRDGAGELVKRAADLQPGMALSLQFADGRADAVATGEEGTAGGLAPRTPVRKSKNKDPADQGTLF